MIQYEARAELTREELHRLAWQEPLSKLAARYGVTGTALKKICTKHDIPVPGRGHWAKVRAGSKPRRAPLPKRKNSGIIRIYGLQAPQRAPIQTETLERWRTFEANEANQIRVKRRAANLHPAASAIKRTLERGSPNHDGLLECVGEHLVRARVARKSVRRAVLIVDALVRAALERGWEVRRPQRPDGGWGEEQAALLVEGVPVTFRLSDKLRRIELEPPEDDTDLELFGARRTKLVPAGGMRLVLCTFGYSTPDRTWEDTNTRKLEDRLNDVMIALREHAERKRIARAEQEKQDRRRAEEAHRQKTERQRRELEEKHTRDLLEEASAWARARNLRAYLDALEEEADRVGLRINAEWLSWAHLQVAREDPLPQRLERARVTESKT